MTFFELIEKRHIKRTKPSDVFYVRRHYNTHSSGYETMKHYKENFTEALFVFQELLKSFDMSYTGHVEIFKNRPKNQIIIVNL